MNDDDGGGGQRPGGDQAAPPESPMYGSASSSLCSTPRHVRAGSLQRFRRQMQRKWRWGPTNVDVDDENVNMNQHHHYNNNNNNNYNYRSRSSNNREHWIRSSWNFELLANQKWQWYQIQSKSKVKACPLPQLPGHKELVSELSPIHARLSCENSIAKRHPVYKCSEVQAEAAGDFSSVMKHYMESLCSNLRSHTITNVQSNNDKVSLLLKDSFIGSFPSRDHPFIKLLVDTQLFSVLTDTKLSTYENEPF